MNKPGDLKFCCGQPPRLLSGEGFGYALVCTECGNGLGGGFRGDTFQSAQFLWNRDFDISLIPKPTSVPLFLLKELNNAHDVLRNIAFVLGAGGYNATDVDAKVFHSKISDGIDMLTKPLLDRIEELEKKKDLPEGMQIVTTLEFEGCKYNLRKNGYVDVTILATGRGFTRHIHNIGLPVQQALENHLKTQKEASHG